MLVPKVTVRLHSQRSPILVTQPPANSRDIDSALNAPGCEQMAEVVVRDSMCSHLLTSLGKSFLTLGHRQNASAPVSVFSPEPSGNFLNPFQKILHRL